jgi:hypothetical protein
VPKAAALGAPGQSGAEGTGCGIDDVGADETGPAPDGAVFEGGVAAAGPVDAVPVHPPIASAAASRVPRNRRALRQTLTIAARRTASPDVDMGSSSLGGRFAAVDLATIRQPGLHRGRTRVR